MLKQILATSALIAIAALSVGSASAADTGKLRQLVVEPAGTPAADPAILKKKKLQPLLLVQPGKGIPTASVTANAGNGNGQAGKITQFVAAPGQGIPTPGAGGKGKPQNGLPALATLPGGGIPTPIEVADAGADPGTPTGNKAFPLIVAPASGITTPAGAPASADATPSADAGVPVAGALPAPADTGAPAASVDGGQPVAADSGAAAASEPLVTPVAPAPGLAVQSPGDLYSLLTGRGYGVEVLKRDRSGNLVYYVTIPGQPQEADLLLVDRTYGKVLERKHIAANGYDHPVSYAPSYAAAYAGDANCDHAAGY